jgi:hypothetical protein
MSSSPDLENARADEQRSHWAGWTLALLAVPVVYVLTLPPIVLTLGNSYGWGRTSPTPKWLTLYAAPGMWLYKESPLQPVLTTYALWWSSKIQKP